MIKIGITGSLASGKTTASRYLSKKYGPLFSADKAVKALYAEAYFKSLISRKFKLINNSLLKKNLKKKILEDKRNIKILEKIVHPIVRRKLKNFTTKHMKRRILFYEIPLLIESKLMKYFDVIIFIKAKKKLRLKRFKSKKGSKELFNIFNNKQMKDKKKIKFCDHVVVNEKKLNILKKKLSDIMNQYV
jgi:dephospho-CoA kinase